MSSVFAITSDKINGVRLNSKGQGDVSFTVTSTSGQPITALARVVPQNPAQQSWYTIQDDAQRAYVNSEKIVVQIAAPANTPAGKYSFFLKVSSVRNPDEIYTDGPPVAVEVTQAEVKPPMKLWPIWVAVAAVLIIGIGAYFLMSKKKVPDLVGLTQTEAEAKAKTAELKVAQIDWKRTGTHVTNTVISQVPAAGADIPPDQALRVTLEQDPFVIVPKLVGMDIKAAQDAIVNAHLKFGSSTNQQDAPGNPNTVLSQDPRPDLKVAPDTPVTLMVKATTVRVPSLVGQNISQALGTLGTNNLVGNPVQVVNPGVPPLTVYNQSPPPSTIVARQSQVTIFVALPLAAQPGIARGMTLQQFNSLPLATRANIQANRVVAR